MLCTATPATLSVRSPLLPPRRRRRAASSAGDRGPGPSPPLVRIRIASNGRHHGLARTIEVPTPDAAAEPPSGARPGCASDPCSPLIRHRRPRTRIAHHLPRPIRRVPHQPAGPAHVRLAIRSRTLPNRTATSARSRGDHDQRGLSVALHVNHPIRFSITSMRVNSRMKPRSRSCT